MVRAATAGQLTSRVRPHIDSNVRFALATPAHDAPLRRLLRENPMPGPIALSLEREPSFFAAAALEGPEHHAIVAVEDGCVVAAGSISARLRFINGQPMRVGYLGALRLDASCRARSSILLRGYDAFRKLHEQDGPPIYLTSIVAGNLPARRFLEKGLPGMPAYHFLGEFVTLIIPCPRRPSLFRPISRAGKKLRRQGIRLMPGSDERGGELLELLYHTNQKYQFAPVWAASELHPENFRMACAPNGRLVACAAIWDQRSVKQTVVRGYSASLRWARPLINLRAAFLGQPRLPRIGTSISHAFLSHLAVDPESPHLLDHLITLLRGVARGRGIDYLALGFDSRDPRVAHLRKAFRPREIISRIYATHWPDGAILAQSLDERLLAPEVAIL